MKEGWPSLTEDDALRGVDLFLDRFGSGVIKLFGGEPLLEPEVVRSVMEYVRHESRIQRVYLSTNGLPLTEEWLQYLQTYPKAVLTLSIDGIPEDNRAYRKAKEGVGDAYDHILSLLPQLHKVPRVVVTQVLAPSTAARAGENFRHLLSLGFWRFNLLPGYYMAWTEGRLAELRQGFDDIGKIIAGRWHRGERLYLRNLFTLQPTPFFNTGFILDADRTIHPTNVGLSGNFDDLLEVTRCGDLDAPPSQEELIRRADEVNGLLEQRLPPRIWSSTLAADAELTRLCRSLYPHYRRYRARRRSVA